MAREYTVLNIETGREITFDWDDENDLTDADLEEIFLAAGQFKPPEPTATISSTPHVEFPRNAAYPGRAVGGAPTEEFPATPITPLPEEELATAGISDKKSIPVIGGVVEGVKRIPQAVAAGAHEALAGGQRYVAGQMEKAAKGYTMATGFPEESAKLLETAKGVKQEATTHGQAAEILDPTWYRSEKIQAKLEKIKEHDPNLANSFQMGDISGATQMLVFDAYMRGDQTAKDRAIQLSNEVGKVGTKRSEATKEKKGVLGTAENVLNATSEMLPMMGKGLALNAVPVAGPILATSMWAKQGAGEIITALKDRGVDDDTSLAYGILGGIPYALVERLQVGQVANIGAKKIVGDSVKKKLLQIVKTKGIDYLKENAEEVAQSLIEEKAINEAVKSTGVQVDPKLLRQRYLNIVGETLKQTVGPMGVLTALGLGAGAGRVAIQRRGMTEQPAAAQQPIGELERGLPPATAIQSPERTQPPITIPPGGPSGVVLPKLTLEEYNAVPPGEGKTAAFNRLSDLDQDRAVMQYKEEAPSEGSAKTGETGGQAEIGGKQTQGIPVRDAGRAGTPEAPAEATVEVGNPLKFILGKLGVKNVEAFNTLDEDEQAKRFKTVDDLSRSGTGDAKIAASGILELNTALDKLQPPTAKTLEQAAPPTAEQPADYTGKMVLFKGLPKKYKGKDVTKVFEGKVVSQTATEVTVERTIDGKPQHWTIPIERISDVEGAEEAPQEAPEAVKTEEEQPSDWEKELTHLDPKIIASGPKLASKIPGLKFDAEQPGLKHNKPTLQFTDTYTGDTMYLEPELGLKGLKELHKSKREKLTSDKLADAIAKEVGGLTYVGKKQRIGQVTGAERYNTEDTYQYKTNDGTEVTINPGDTVEKIKQYLESKKGAANVQPNIATEAASKKTEGQVKSDVPSEQTVTATQPEVAPPATPQKLQTRVSDAILNRYIKKGATEGKTAQELHNNVIQLLDKSLPIDIAEASGITEDEAKTAIADIKAGKTTDAAIKVKTAVAPRLLYNQTVDEVYKEITEPRDASGKIMFSKKEPMQQNIFGGEKPLSEIESEEKKRLERAEIKKRTEQRRGGEADMSGLPMFEDQDIEGSQQTLKLSKNIVQTDTPNPDIRYAKKERPGTRQSTEEYTPSPEEEKITRAIYSNIGKHTPGSVRIVKGTTEQRELSEVVKEATGKEIVWLDVDDQLLQEDIGFTFDGFMIKGAKVPEVANRIFISTTAEKPIQFVAYHEFAHFIQQNPDYTAAFWDAVKLTQKGAELVARKGRDETMADIAGEMMAEPDFWKSIDDKTILQAFIDKLMEILDRLAKALTGRKDAKRYTQYVEDVEELRDTLKGILREYGGELATGEQRMAASEKADQTKTPEFKKWFGDWEAELIANKISDPDAAIKFIDDGLPRKDRSTLSFPLVQRLMLGLAHNNEVFRGIIGLVPVDVMNGITGQEVDTNKLGRNQSVFRDALNSPIPSKYTSSLEGVLTKLSAEFRSFLEAGTNKVSGPAIDAKYFNLREMGRLLSFKGLTDLSSSNRGVELVGAGKGTKPTFSEGGTGKNDPTMLAALLHNQFLATHNSPMVDVKNKNILQSVSAVKDENGEPLVVYHGTNKEFSIFKKGKGGKSSDSDTKGGIFFSNEPTDAEFYTWGKLSNQKDTNANIVPVFLSLRNPRIVNMGGGHKQPALVKRWMEEAKQDGNDGLILKNVYDAPIGRGSDVYVAFDPTQIKSATGNLGTFDPENPDIRFAKRTIKEEDLPALYEEAKGFNKKKSAKEIRKTYANKRNAGETARWLLRTTTGRLMDISPVIRDQVQKHVSGITLDTAKATRKILPLLNALKKMPSADYRVFDLAAKQADSNKINELAKQYGFEDALKAYRDTFNGLIKRLMAAGYDTGYLKDYFPRMSKDRDAYRNYIRGTPEWGSMDEAIREKEKKIGRAMTDDEQEEFLDLYIRGYGDKMNAAKPGNLKERKVRFISNEMNSLLEDTMIAIPLYVERMIKKAARKEFFDPQQKDTELEINNIDDSIGEYVSQLIKDKKLDPRKQDELIGVLKSFFNYKPTNKSFAAIKNLGYMTTMGSGFSSMFSQMADAAFGFYTTGAGEIPAVAKALFGKTGLTVKDLGVDNVAGEFRDPGKLSSAVDRLFKAVGIKWGDSIFKNAFLEANLRKYQRMAKSGKLSKDFKNDLKNVFGDQADSVVEDLADGIDSDNVKLLMLNQMSKFQPVTLLQVPQAYLDMPRGRIAYALKTYQINQLNAIVDEAKRGMTTATTQKDFKDAAVRVATLMAFLVACGIGTDAFKDYLFRRKANFGEYLTDNMLKLALISRYTTWKFRTDGVKNTLLNMVSPQISWIDYIGKDIIKIQKAATTPGPNNFAWKDLQSIRVLPVIGQELYWWYGGGKESVQRREKYKAVTYKNERKIAAHEKQIKWLNEIGDTAQAKIEIDKFNPELDKIRRQDSTYYAEELKKEYPKDFSTMYDLQISKSKVDNAKARIRLKKLTPGQERLYSKYRKEQAALAAK